MNRRKFINTTALSGLGLSFSSCKAFTERKKPKNTRGSFSMDKNQVSIYTNARVTASRIFHISDTHLSIDDQRGEAFHKFSKRMAGAYKSNSHFQTGQELTSVS